MKLYCLVLFGGIAFLFAGLPGAAFAQASGNAAPAETPASPPDDGMAPRAVTMPPAPPATAPKAKKHRHAMHRHDATRKTARAGISQALPAPAPPPHGAAPRPAVDPGEEDAPPPPQ